MACALGPLDQRWPPATHGQTAIHRHRDTPFQIAALQLDRVSRSFGALIQRLVQPVTGHDPVSKTRRACEIIEPEPSWPGKGSLGINSNHLEIELSAKAKQPVVSAVACVLTTPLKSDTKGGFSPCRSLIEVGTDDSQMIEMPHEVSLTQSAPLSTNPILIQARIDLSRTKHNTNSQE